MTTFLFEAANFLVLAAVLGWLFFNPVRQALADRRSKMDAEEQLAANQLAEAEHAKEEIDEVKRNLQAELSEMRKREIDAAHAQSERILEATRAAADREMESSRHQIALLADTQLNRLSRSVAFAAADTVGHLLEQLNESDIHEALFKSACDKLSQLPRDELAPVTVESARALTQMETATLEQALGVDSVHYRVAEEIGVGVRISTARGLVDASASGLVNFARQAMEKEMMDRVNHGAPDVSAIEPSPTKAIVHE